MRTRLNPMVVRLRRGVFAELKLDDPANLRLARAAFYLGIGMEETRRLLKQSADSSERQAVLETATMLGMDDTDVIVVI